MDRHWFIKYSGSVKSEKVSFYDFTKIYVMARFYNAVVSLKSHSFGQTLVVSFSKHFV